jgi:hypothetical protein
VDRTKTYVPLSAVFSVVRLDDFFEDYYLGNTVEFDRNLRVEKQSEKLNSQTNSNKKKNLIMGL